MIYKYLTTLYHIKETERESIFISYRCQQHVWRFLHRSITEYSKYRMNKINSLLFSRNINANRGLFWSGAGKTLFPLYFTETRSTYTRSTVWQISTSRMYIRRMRDLSWHQKYYSQMDAVYNLTSVSINIFRLAAFYHHVFTVDLTIKYFSYEKKYIIILYSKVLLEKNIHFFFRTHINYILF